MFLCRKACSYEVRSLEWIPNRFLLHAACLAIKGRVRDGPNAQPILHVIFVSQHSFKRVDGVARSDLKGRSRSSAVHSCGNGSDDRTNSASQMSQRVYTAVCCQQNPAQHFLGGRDYKVRKKSLCQTQSCRIGITRVSVFSFDVLEGLVQFKQQCFLLAMRLFCCTSRYKVFATSCWQKMSEQVSLSLLVCRMYWYVQGHLHKRRRPVKHLTSSCSQNSVKVLVVRSFWIATGAESGRDGIHKLYDSSRSESWPQLHHGVLPSRHCQRLDVFFIRRTHAVVS